MTYEAYLGYDREALLEKLQEVMSEKRFQHVLGVEAAAITLAKRYGYDEEKAGLAGLLHDYAKELPDDAFLALIDRYGLPESLKAWDNNVWHGLVGIYQIKEDLGLENSEILRSIERHTVGASDLSLLDKIIYVADYIEAGRAFPGVERARELAMVSLEKAVAYETAHTLAYLAEKGLPIYPQTLETYNAYVHYLHD